MLQVALRGLVARRLRLLLTASAVALGVTLIAGTYVFGDTINRSFDRIFTASYAGIDVVVTPTETFDSETQESPGLPAALLRELRGVDGVAEADGALFSQVVVLDKGGDRVSSGGAPNFLSSISPVDDFNALEVADGRLPRAPGEAVLDKATADRKGFAVGDALDVQGDGPKTTLRLVGTTRIAGVDSFGGAATVGVLTSEAQRILDRRGEFDELSLKAEEGVTPDELVGRLAPVVGDRGEVRTGQAEGSQQAQDIKDDLSFLTTGLLAFAGISLFVGAFLIFNTFSITVAQRTREFALLRVLGASRRQVLGSVLAEGLLLGVVGSALGLALGVLTAEGLQALFKAIGVDLPASGTVVLTRTVVVALVAGVLVTLVSALAPALRATRVPPVAALREGVPLTERRSRVAPAAGTALALLGLVLMAVGLFTTDDETTGLSLVGGGAGATFLGVALLSPRLVPPLARLVGRPIAALGMPGVLARENAIRQPGRTAVTAAALMVGVALVAFASIFAGSFRTYIADSVDAGAKADAVVQSTDGFSPFTGKAREALRAVPGVADVTPLRSADAQTPAGDDLRVTGVDPRTFPQAFSVQWDEGDDGTWARLGADGAVVGRDFADEEGLALGDRFALRTVAGTTASFVVRGVHDDPSLFLTKVLAPVDRVERDLRQDEDSYLLLRFAGGAQPLPAVERLLTERFPAAEALTTDEFKDEQGDQVTQLLGLVIGLLALSIVVSLFGIVNTLMLAISERTRELGLLRAVGTTRKQVKRMVRAEAVITALIGSVLGLGLGLLLAVLVGRAIDDLPLTVPVGTLLGVLVAGGVAGVLAAVWPARRAAKLDVLEALAYE